MKEKEEEERFDQEKMAGLTIELIGDITALIISKPKSLEATAAAVAALAHVLVIVTTKTVGKEGSVDIISMALSKAFETVSETRKEIEREQNTNTKTSGS